MSDNPKSKGKAAETKKTKPVDMKRMLNLGKEVELSFGKYTVKELSVFDLLSTLADGLEFFIAILDTDTKNEIELITSIVANKEVQEQFCKIVSLSCQSEDYDLFKKMTTSDLLKIIKALKEVVDFQELKETFFELGLQKYLTNQPPISTEK